MSISPDLLRAATETYRLEVLLSDGLSSDALEKAIAAALAAHEKTVIERIAAQADSFAISEDSDPNPDLAASLRWFAHKLRDDLGTPAAPYEPVGDDLVEVTITGTVARWENDDDGQLCANCQQAHSFTWSVLDDDTGDEYFFRSHPRAPRVRVLTRKTEEGQ